MSGATNQLGHRGFVPLPLAERFWSRVDQRGPTECWNWQGFKNPNGYGVIASGGRQGRRNFTAHRVSWELANGRAPEPGMCVCHSCDNRSCVNPAHLWLGTNRDNVLDMIAKGRGREQRKTHCPRGHPYDDDNTYRSKGVGHRQCRKCMAEKCKRQRQAQRAA